VPRRENLNKTKPIEINVILLKMQRTEYTNYVETGDFPRDPFGILKKGKKRILHFPQSKLIQFYLKILLFVDKPEFCDVRL